MKDSPCSPVSIDAIASLGVAPRLMGIESLQLVDCELSDEGCGELALALRGMQRLVYFTDSSILLLFWSIFAEKGLCK